MNKIPMLFSAILILTACKTKEPDFTLTEGTFIRDVQIITTEDGTYFPFTGHVLCEAGKIIYVGQEEPRLQGKIETIDGSGKFLIPGLIDSHTHLNEVQGMLPHHIQSYPDLVEEFNRQMPRSYLYHGFTSLINLGGISEVQLKDIKSQPFHPDIYHTGSSGAPVANGYPMNFAPEEYRFEGTPNFIYLPSEAERIPDGYKPEDHSPEAVVSRIKKAGGIAVKTYYERGFRGMPELPVPTMEIMNDLLRNAHSNGLVLTAHGNSLEAHSFLADAGVDVIAHGMWNWGTYREVPADSLPPEIKEVLDIQIQKQIGYTPTLTVLSGEEALADEAFLNIPELQKVVPSKILDWYKTEEGQWFARELFSEYQAEEVHSIYGNIQAHAMRALKYLSDKNGFILFGTDTPSAPTYGNQPGYNGYWELQLMAEAGMPLQKILASATINNARAFKLDSVGSIALGKKANMLLLEKNPLEDIEAYNSIDILILNGKIIEREKLSVDHAGEGQ